MKSKNKDFEKTYRDSDGYVFLPDPKREIALAVAMIQQFIDTAAGDPVNWSDTELKVIRHTALRIAGEVAAIQNERGGNNG